MLAVFIARLLVTPISIGQVVQMIFCVTIKNWKVWRKSGDAVNRSCLGFAKQQPDLEAVVLVVTLRSCMSYASLV